MRRPQSGSTLRNGGVLTTGTGSFKQAKLAIRRGTEVVKTVVLQFGKSYLLGRQANTAITLEGQPIARLEILIGLGNEPSLILR